MLKDVCKPSVVFNSVHVVKHELHEGLSAKMEHVVVHLKFAVVRLRHASLLLVVIAQAEEYGHSRKRELAYLVAHSVLHLLGYDHLDEGAQKAQMREREEAVMAAMELSR